MAIHIVHIGVVIPKNLLSERIIANFVFDVVLITPKQLKAIIITTQIYVSNLYRRIAFGYRYDDRYGWDYNSLRLSDA